MSIFSRHTSLRIVFSILLAFIMLVLFLAVLSGPSPVLSDHNSVSAADIIAAATPGSNEPPTSQPAGSQAEMIYTYIPMVLDTRQPEIKIKDAWTSDSQALQRGTFSPEQEMQYWVSGTNNFSIARDVHLQWNQEGPCGESQIYSDTISMDPGQWEHAYPAIAPDCSGVFTSTVQVEYQHLNPVRTMQFVVSEPGGSTIFISDQQGFDRCYRPDVDEMQTWWNESPYRVFNIYIGGYNFYCKNYPFEAAWVHQVAEQGWTFIQTWVGPQADCSSYNHTISLNLAAAYQQGRDEADDAAATSIALGFSGENIIYYDVEGYPNDAICRNSLKSFLNGWVERLHELGMKAGAYGAGCTSYVTDWTDIDNPPDDVWIAHWIREYYDADVSVWDARCVDNELWADHRRLKQYAGDHVETWSGISLGIDSDVLDGEITALNPDTSEGTNLNAGVLMTQYGTAIQAAEMLEPDHGWVLTQERLFVTEDSGGKWQDITPNDGGVLGVTFNDPKQAWVVSRTDTDGGLMILRTEDGGDSWMRNPMPLILEEAVDVVDAHINTLSDDTAWVALKLFSGSNFSRGKLFFTGDGGDTWEERGLPLGEAVTFQNELRGWVAGGPGGDQLFYTEDGGWTWVRQVVYLPPGKIPAIGSPRFSDALNGQLVVGLHSSLDSELAVYKTEDGGVTWSLAQSYNVDPGLASSVALSGIFVPAGKFNNDDDRELRTLRNLPQGVVSLDFFDSQHGWAVVQNGHCEGDKETSATEALRCEQRWQLLATDDGGDTWRAVSMPSR